LQYASIERVKKTVKIFKDFDEAEKFDRDYYLRLTPEERLAIAEQLRREYQKIHYGSEQRFRRVFRIVKQT